MDEGKEPQPSDDTEVVAENVIDFLNVSRSSWNVEWVGESEEVGEVRLYTVTASGEEEQRLLQEFLAGLDPRLKQIIDTFPKLFALSRPYPSSARREASHLSPK